MLIRSELRSFWYRPIVSLILIIGSIRKTSLLKGEENARARFDRFGDVIFLFRELLHVHIACEGRRIARGTKDGSLTGLQTRKRYETWPLKFDEFVISGILVDEQGGK